MEEDIRGDPVTDELGVILGLYASPLTELLADPAPLGVPEREPESVLDCAWGGGAPLCLPLALPTLGLSLFPLRPLAPGMALGEEAATRLLVPPVLPAFALDAG